MRRLTQQALAVALIAFLIVSTAGCKRRKKRAQVDASADTGVIATIINVADPRSSVQLIKGFYDVENNAWRWTMPKFSVILHPPAGAAQNGATLALKFVIPDAEMARLKSVSLSATINGLTLPTETYSKAGDLVYSKTVAGSALGGDTVTVDFALDNSFKPGRGDERELGLIVSTVGFELK